MYRFSDKWSGELGFRYVDYWEERGFRMGNRWAWMEKVRMKRPNREIEFNIGMTVKWATDDFGIPFHCQDLPWLGYATADELIARYDRYYRARLGWRQWNAGSMRRLAKRAWNAKIVDKP